MKSLIKTAAAGDRGDNGKGIMKYTQTKLNHGYANRILTIDLGSGEIQAPVIDPAVREYFIG